MNGRNIIEDTVADGMRSEEECWRIVDEAVASMEMEGFHPTEEDRLRAFLYASGRITMEEAMRSITSAYERYVSLQVSGWDILLSGHLCPSQ